jgi:thiol:disulfide interchange protein
LCSIFSFGSRGVKKLCVDLGRLSRWLLAAIWVIVLVPAPAVWAYAHHTSSVRFLDYSPATFEIARREGKPVFLLISAVWCYWCKYFDQNTLRNDEVSKYLNQHYVSIFVDHDLRVDSCASTSVGCP